MNAKTIAQCTAAGAQMLVVGSAIFKESEPLRGKFGRANSAGRERAQQPSPTPGDDARPRRRTRDMSFTFHVVPRDSEVVRSMLTILLVRSGLTEYDCQGRIQGTLDVPLSGEGRQQATATADELAARGTTIDALYAGPCPA